MPTREVTISNKLGLHARAAAKLVATATRFHADIHVQKAGQRVNGKSIMGVMMLAASQGTTLTLTAHGEDETAAANYLVQRLATLQKYAQHLAPEKHCLFLTYRELLHCTQPVLDLLQDYLQLQQPLSEHYEVTGTTGAFGVGDKSDQIRSGRSHLASRVLLIEIFDRATQPNHEKRSADKKKAHHHEPETKPKDPAPTPSVGSIVAHPCRSLNR